MQLNRDSISRKERRNYAVLQVICWLLAIASLGIFALDISVPMKWLALAAMTGFLLGAVVFNWARRFGIRVLWSPRFREKA